jgi:hypothetical protein
MKRIIGNIALFVITLGLFCVLYIKVFRVSVSVFGILLAFFVVYGFCMALGEKSIRELKKYEQQLIHFGLNAGDEKKVLLYSLTALSPAYFCILLVSVIPLYIYEVWLITVLPCILLNCLPASSVLDEYYCLTHQKRPFLLSFISITVVLCLVGASGSTLLLRQLTM